MDFDVFALLLATRRVVHCGDFTTHGVNRAVTRLENGSCRVELHAVEPPFLFAGLTERPIRTLKHEIAIFRVYVEYIGVLNHGHCLTALSEDVGLLVANTQEPAHFVNYVVQLHKHFVRGVDKIGFSAGRECREDNSRRHEVVLFGSERHFQSESPEEPLIYPPNS